MSEGVFSTRQEKKKKHYQEQEERFIGKLGRKDSLSDRQGLGMKWNGIKSAP
jgi:hypothetical protein